MKPGLSSLQPLLQLVAGADPAAAEADDVRDAAVQVDHGVAAGGAVQAVDVLGDHAAQHLGGLQGGERPVATVGQGAGHAGPADVVKTEQVLAGMITQMPTRFETAEEDVWVMGALVDVNGRGLADSFEQLMVPAPV